MRALQQWSDATLRVVVYTVAIAVCLAVAFIIAYPGSLRTGSIDVSYAPHFHALLNGTVAILLGVGYVAIRKRKILLHRILMLSAFALSTVFLVSYVVYHTQKAEPVYFRGTGLVRVVYLVILITHSTLAAGIVPLALFTIARAWRSQFAHHRRIARWTLPLWLYVAVSGVVVYVMLYVWQV